MSERKTRSAGVYHFETPKALKSLEKRRGAIRTVEKGRRLFLEAIIITKLPDKRRKGEFRTER